MTIQGAETGSACTSQSPNCVDKFGCPPTVCPDFSLKRHDTKPPFKVAVEDCDGPIDLTEDDLVLEINMWALAKLKKAITAEVTQFQLADNIGFEQVMVGDIIVMERVRRPEHMLVTAFDETNCYIQVQRAYSGTDASAWKKGTAMKIFRVMGGPAEIETFTQDLLQIDGTTEEDVATDTFLVYEWDANATCLPGCYWLEFKLLKMEVGVLSLLSATAGDVSIFSWTPSNLSSTDFGCTSGAGVEWVRRFPSNGEGFLIKITNTPTGELV